MRTFFRNGFRFSLFALALTLGFPHFSRADAVQDRLNALEKEVVELKRLQEENILRAEETSGSVHSFLRDDLTLGGFFEPALLGVTGPDTNTQLASTSNTLGLNLSATFTHRLRFTTQFITTLGFPLQNEHQDPRAGTVGLTARREFAKPNLLTVVAQGYLEYRISDGFKIQGGLGYVPYGLTAQLRDPVLFIRRGGPQILRTTNLLFPLWEGLHVHGIYPREVGTFGYNTYTFTNTFKPGSPGTGARVWWSLPRDSLKLGTSVQVAKNLGETTEAFAFDMQTRMMGAIVTAEFTQLNVNGNDPWSAYLEPMIPINAQQSVLLYFFGDYADSSTNVSGTGTTVLSDPYRKWEYGFGINWLPVAATRLRVGLTQNDYVGDTSSPQGVNRDYLSLDLSAGVAF